MSNLPFDPSSSSQAKASSIARTEATGGSLDPDFLAWQSSLPVDIELLEVDVQGSLAHIKALAHAELLSAEEASCLSAALRSLPKKVRSGAVTLPMEEDVHMAVEAWLHQEVGEVSHKLHTGRSRNDQVATDFRLWTREAVAQIEAGLSALSQSSTDWKQRWEQTPMPAYTHRQVAIPVLASTWMEAALDRPLARDRELLEQVRREIAESPLGAGAVAGTTLAIDAQVSADAMDFAHPPRNPMDAVGSRDFAQTLLFMAARCAQHIARFCTDVVELASDGLVILGGGIACGSSMMPHKRNPDLFELLRAEAALRQGDLIALMSTFQGLGNGYHRDLQQDKLIVFRSVKGLLASFEMLCLGLQQLDLKEDACLDALYRGDAIATDLTEALVQAGHPFRKAYVSIGSLVAKQRSKGKVLMDLNLGDLQEAGLPESLLHCLDLKGSAQKRTKSS